jgi:hypothetical protein
VFLDRRSFTDAGVGIVAIQRANHQRRRTPYQFS